MTNLDVLRAAVQQTWTPRPSTNNNDATVKVCPSWSPPRATVAEPPIQNDGQNVLRQPSSPIRQNNDILPSPVNYGMPNFIKLLDIPTASNSSPADLLYRNNVHYFNGNISSDLNNLTQKTVPSIVNQTSNSSVLFRGHTGFPQSNIHSPLNTANPSPATSPETVNYKHSHFNLPPSTVKMPSNKSLQTSPSLSSFSQSTSTSSNNQNIGLLSSFNTNSLGNFGSGWGLSGSPGSIGSYSGNPGSLGLLSGSSTSGVEAPNLRASGNPIHGIIPQTRSLPGSCEASSVRLAATSFGGADSGIPTNCSDLIRSMAAKYNSRLNLYNSAIKNISKSFATSNLLYKPESLKNVSSIDFPNSTLSQDLRNIFPERNPTLAKHSPQHLLNSYPYHETLRNLSVPTSTSNGTHSQVSNPTASLPQILPSTHFKSSGSQSSETTASEISSAEVFLNLVRNASNIHNKISHTASITSEQDNNLHLHLQQRQYEIERYLRGSAKRSASTGVTPLDLSSGEPIMKRPKLETDQFIDIEGDINKSEPSTPLDVGIPSPFWHEKRDNTVFGDLFTPKSNINYTMPTDNLNKTDNSILNHSSSNNDDRENNSNVLETGTTNHYTISSSTTVIPVSKTACSSPSGRSPSSSISVATSSTAVSPVPTTVSVNQESCSCCSDPTTWTVEEVHDFVKNIDICAEYADLFRSERIDGWSLSLLTESHLTSSLHLKLGPALKLRSVLDSRLRNCTTGARGSCDVCFQDKPNSCNSTSSNVAKICNINSSEYSSPIMDDKFVINTDDVNLNNNMCNNAEMHNAVNDDQNGIFNISKCSKTDEYKREPQ